MNMLNNILMFEFVLNQMELNIFYHDLMNIHYQLNLLMEKVYLLIKVDPKYPPELIEQNVQGEVVLYGVVHANGLVDSIQVVRGIDPQLDANAKSAFAQWKFTPASRAGSPIDLEVIAHIPFKIRDDR